MSVNGKTSPVSPRKRSFDTASTSGRKNGDHRRVREGQRDDDGEQRRVHDELQRRERSRARARPATTDRPSARQISLGVGKLLNGDATQTNQRRRQPSNATMRPVAVVRSRRGSGRNASRRAAVISSAVPSTIDDAAVLRAPFGARVRRDRLGLPVRDDLHATVGEARRRLLLEPRLHRERALLGELHVRVGGALVVGVAVDLDDRAARDDEVAEQLLERAPRSRA